MAHEHRLCDQVRVVVLVTSGVLVQDLVVGLFSRLHFHLHVLSFP